MNRFSILLLLLFFVHSVFGEIKLPVVFSDGVVLQRNQQFTINGWASPNEKVSLNFNGRKYNTKADKNGDWTFELPAQKAGGPYDMIFRGKNEIKVSNILFGDVWVCSGQSNMTVKMERVKERYPDEIRNANYPDIRYLFVPTKNDLKGPDTDLPPGEWKEVISENMMDIGAIPYFFAKKVYAESHVPIGLINSSVGGTPIEAWISEEGLKDYPEIVKKIEQNKDTAYVASFRPPVGRYFLLF